jgi:hypothetical protein
MTRFWHTSIVVITSSKYKRFDKFWLPQRVVAFQDQSAFEYFIADRAVVIVKASPTKYPDLTTIQTMPQ